MNKDTFTKEELTEAFRDLSNELAERGLPQQTVVLAGGGLRTRD